MQLKDAQDLLARYHTGEVTEEEKTLVETWYLTYQDEHAEIAYQKIEVAQKKSLASLIDGIQKKKRRKFLPLIGIAASIAFILAAGTGYLFLNKPEKHLQATLKTNPADLLPGGTKAVLTLADGQTITLDGARNGTLASQGTQKIDKTTDGQISYAGAPDLTGKEQQLQNTVTTPRGGNYQLILSDGTKVWLNAASSIKYPVAFNGVERRVELSGEAYFEVAHHKNKPFRVVSGEQTVEVLGTHFNINAYNDEDAVKTTLLVGSVKIISKYANTILKPGEQARLNNGDLQKATVDVEEETAWKSGFFSFKDASTETVMRQIARWYDVDIKYEGKIPQREFTGEISKSINAAQLQDILSFKQIHFKTRGRTIIVIP
ncbi:FecR family protein [Pedobacter cryoconitis]|uniref:Ferric-dicitrate binding protein FerR (Iron transport regulator) n=1 Tax=Pedobacter cryoconitis TaxID=188932 RepID=A0A7X0MIH8_9SPHI|nr:FecR family protein [Pedobacter cryoconitis]MBB6498545.1 ferric-dicitrate binding protein FerR (iron transport regulator) [Pedobacter cryoconitis]